MTQSQPLPRAPRYGSMGRNARYLLAPGSARTPASMALTSAPGILSEPVQRNASPTVTATPPKLASLAKYVLDDGEQCCICLEDFAPRQRACILPCSHRLHAHCAGLWLQVASRRNCPTCRHDVPLSAERFITLCRASTGPITGDTSPSSTWTAPLVLEEPHDPPAEQVRSIMTHCMCSRSLAESALLAYRLENGDHVDPSKVNEMAVTSLKVHGGALLTAMQSEDYPATERLLREGSCGLDVRLPSGSPGFRKTPLILAVRRHWYSEVQLICEAITNGIGGPNARIDSCDEDGLSPLMWTALTCDTQMCDLLLSFGASTEIKNKDKLTALDLATTESIRFRLRGKRSKLL